MEYIERIIPILTIAGLQAEWVHKEYEQNLREIGGRDFNFFLQNTQ